MSYIYYYDIIYLYIFFIFLLRLLVLIQQMFDATILLVVPRAHLHFDLRQSLRDFRKSCHVPNKLLWNPLFLGKEGPNYLLTSYRVSSQKFNFCYNLFILYLKPFHIQKSRQSENQCSCCANLFRVQFQQKHAGRRG